jgi:hypothetical protein
METNQIDKRKIKQASKTHGYREAKPSKEKSNKANYDF